MAPSPEDGPRTTPRDALDLPEAELREHISAMRAFARRLLGDGPHVEDIVNDAILVACGKEKSQRPDEKNQSEYRAWLCGILRMTVLTYRHVAKRNAEPMPPDRIEALSSAYCCSTLVEERNALAEVLRVLPVYERGLILRHVIEGLSIREIADEDAAPRSSVSSAYHRSLAKLRELLVVAVGVLLLRMDEARAHAAALRARIASSFARSPMRHFASVAAGAVIMGAMPHPRARASPEGLPVVRTTTTGSVVVAIHSLRAEPAPVASPSMRRPSAERATQGGPPDRERSPFDIMAGSALRLRTKQSAELPRPSMAPK